MKTKKQEIDKFSGQWSQPVKDRIERAFEEGRASAEECFNEKLEGILSLQEALIFKKVEKLIDNCKDMGETHGFRPRWINVDELKQSLKSLQESKPQPKGCGKFFSKHGLVHVCGKESATSSRINYCPSCLKSGRSGK